MGDKTPLNFAAERRGLMGFALLGIVTASRLVGELIVVAKVGFMVVVWLLGGGAGTQSLSFSAAAAWNVSVGAQGQRRGVRKRIVGLAAHRNETLCGLGTVKNGQIVWDVGFGTKRNRLQLAAAARAAGNVVTGKVHEQFEGGFLLDGRRRRNA